MKNNSLSPLFLQSKIEVLNAGGTYGGYGSLGDGGSTKPLELYNPNKTAMLVDQFRFSFIDPNMYGQAALDGIPYNYYAALGVEVLLGAIPLTNKTVTLGALAPRYIGQQQQTDNVSGPAGDNVLVWHLPKPLYVPPLVQLTVNVKKQKAFPADTGLLDTIAPVVVSVVGRSLPSDFPVPGSIDIPWVTETKCNTEDTSFVSADSDLVNSNGVPYHVTQFVGLSYAHATSYDGPTRNALNVQMSLSNGTMLIRDHIPFFIAFPSDRGILPVSALLQPGAFVRLELEAPFEFVAAGPEAVDPGCQFAAVAMHGYRSIQTPGTLG